jgi:hypothetical protein
MNQEEFEDLFSSVSDSLFIHSKKYVSSLNLNYSTMRFVYYSIAAPVFLFVILALKIVLKINYRFFKLYFLFDKIHELCFTLVNNSINFDDKMVSKNEIISSINQYKNMFYKILKDDVRQVLPEMNTENNIITLICDHFLHFYHPIINDHDGSNSVEKYYDKVINTVKLDEDYLVCFLSNFITIGIFLVIIGTIFFIGHCLMYTIPNYVRTDKNKFAKLQNKFESKDKIQFDLYQYLAESSIITFIGNLPEEYQKNNPIRLASFEGETVSYSPCYQNYKKSRKGRVLYSNQTERENIIPLLEDELKIHSNPIPCRVILEKDKRIFEYKFLSNDENLILVSRPNGARFYIYLDHKILIKYENDIDFINLIRLAKSEENYKYIQRYTDSLVYKGKRMEYKITGSCRTGWRILGDKLGKVSINGEEYFFIPFDEFANYH